MQKIFAVLTFPVRLVWALLRGVGRFLALVGKGAAHVVRGGPGRFIGTQSVFNEALFTCIGYLAKAKGRVSELDIAKTEALFRNMRMSQEARSNAKRFFKRGAQPDFDPRAVGQLFRQTYGKKPLPARVLLAFLANFVMAQGRLDESETQALCSVAESLGLDRSEVERLVRSISAGQAFNDPQATRTARDKVRAAYELIGVAENASSREVKSAYRKLVSANHPDKMIAKKMPEQVVAEANKRMQEIIDAYELICARRGLKH